MKLLSGYAISFCATLLIAACKDSTTPPPNTAATEPTPAQSTVSGATVTSAAPTFSSYRVLIRGKLKASAAGPSTAGSKTIHDEIARNTHGQALAKSEIAHATFLNVSDPSDLLAIDTWSNLNDLNAYYADPAVRAAWGPLMDAPPSVEIWGHPTEWTEWGALAPASLKAPLFLFRIRNRLTADTTESSRVTHNRVAGGESQKKAMALGDTVHTVQLRVDNPHELLFLDMWQDPRKAQQQFFADPETIKGAGEMFATPPDVAVFALTDWYQW